LRKPSRPPRDDPSASRADSGVREQLTLHGKDPETFPNALATMWLRVEEGAEAGVHRVFLWPVGEPIEQLERFGEGVLPFLRP
jgi:hypothetical protein